MQMLDHLLMTIDAACRSEAQSMPPGVILRMDRKPEGAYTRPDDRRATKSERATIRLLKLDETPGTPFAR
jgi:hypothetical protein